MKILAAAAIASVAIAAFSLSARADGMPGPYSGPVTLRVSDWSGVYAGVNAGGAWGDSDWQFENIGGQIINPDFDTGIIFGGHVGLQKQWGALVAGVEVSFSGASNFDGTETCEEIDPDFVCGNELNNLLLVNGRLGYAWDRILVYSTGGYARADIDFNITSAAAPQFNSSIDKHMTGWNLGGGVETMLGKHLILGVEYIHVELSDEEFRGAADIGRIAVEPDFDLVRARVSFKLDREREAIVPLK